MTWKWWWKTVQKIWCFFFIRYFYLSFNEFSCLILPCLLRSKNGHTSFQNMTFLFLLGSLNHLVIKCSKVYLRIWLYSLDKCHSKKFKTYILTGQFRFPCFQVFLLFTAYCILMGGSILHISTEIWIKEWSVFDGFGTTCCYCLCLNNSLLNHCMRRFSQRQDATQKVTEFIGFHENHLISILGTIVSVCNTASQCMGFPQFVIFGLSRFHEMWWYSTS